MFLNTTIKSILFISLFSFIFYSCKFPKNTIVDNTPIEIPEITETNENTSTSNEAMANFLTEYLTLKYKNLLFHKYMYISLKHQQLFLIKNDSTIKKYPISTSKKGIGNQEDSFQTPHGLHTIKRKIGSEVPYGGILESREFKGEIATIITTKTKAPKDYVTSRIMWLQGEDIGINKGRKVDSYNRYIYIHGTPEEGYIGEPASHGCIRMKNKDVIELYNLVDEGTPIFILKN